MVILKLEQAQFIHGVVKTTLGTLMLAVQSVDTESLHDNPVAVRDFGCPHVL